MSKKVPDITTDYLLDEIDKQLHLEKIKLVDRSIVEGNLFTLDEILIPEEYKTKILSTVDSGVNEFFATYLYPLALSDDRFEEYYIAIYNDFDEQYYVYHIEIEMLDDNTLNYIPTELGIIKI